MKVDEVTYPSAGKSVNVAHKGSGIGKINERMLRKSQEVAYGLQEEGQQSRNLQNDI